MEHLSIHNTGDAKQWLFYLLETVDHVKFVKILVTLWAIWTARRKAIHEDIFQSPLSIFGFVSSFLNDLDMVHTKSTPLARPLAAQEARAPLWIAPPPGYLKINVDGGIAKKANKGGYAAVCRTANGEYNGASAVAVEGLTNPGILEALACREALSFGAGYKCPQNCDCM